MKNLYKKSLITALLTITLSGITRAENIELDKIVITPSRIEEHDGDTGRAINVVTSSEIEKSGTQDLAGALTNLTSVDISNYGGPGAAKSIRMRGSTAAQVLVLMDGRPINNPRDGETDLSNIPLDNIARVEVMHGPGSGLYGSSAMGGVVNIITKEPPKEGQKINLYSSFGTAQTYIERMSQGAKISNFSYLISGGYQSSAGFRSNSSLNAEDSNLKLKYTLNSQNDIGLNSGFYKSKAGSPGKSSTPDIDDKQNTLKRFFDFNWDFKPDTRTGLLVKAYQNYDRLEFLANTADTPFETANQKDIHATISRGFDLQFNKQILEIYRLICGFNYVKNMNDSSTTAKHRYIVRAGYLQNHLQLFKYLKLNFGARLDDYSNFGSQINPDLNFLYNFNDDIKFHGSINRSFRAPTFNDLYWPFNGWSQGNPSLNPEKGLSEELGVEIKINKHLTSGLTYYHSNYSQLIQWSDDGSGVWRPQNINCAVIDGMELENKVYILDNFILGVNYTYMIARDKKTHKYLVYQPMNKVDTSLKYNNLNGLTIELKGQFTDQRFNDAGNNTKVKNFFVFGLNASKEFKKGLICFTNIDNLFNRKYQVIHDYSMPGFSFTGGIKAEF